MTFDPAIAFSRILAKARLALLAEYSKNDSLKSCFKINHAYLFQIPNSLFEVRKQGYVRYFLKYVGNNVKDVHHNFLG
jgi:hypothetical protein